MNFYLKVKPSGPEIFTKTGVYRPPYRPPVKDKPP